MILKEAFRYQNYLSETISTALSHIGNTNNMVKVTQEHMRKKANPDAEDEIVVVPKASSIEFEPMDMVRFAEFLMYEKGKLTIAISAAKRECGLDIDAEVANNRTRRTLCEVLGRVSGIRPSEKMTTGRGFKFNAEGNQVAYTYDVKEVTTIDFDRNKVRGIVKELTGKSDKVSTDIDRAMVELEVQYTPMFSVNDSFSDVFDEFLAI